jgi:hypothetical protein
MSMRTGICSSIVKSHNNLQPILKSLAHPMVSLLIDGVVWWRIHCVIVQILLLVVVFSVFRIVREIPANSHDGDQASRELVDIPWCGNRARIVLSVAKGS